MIRLMVLVEILSLMIAAGSIALALHWKDKARYWEALYRKGEVVVGPWEKDAA